MGMWHVRGTGEVHTGFLVGRTDGKIQLGRRRHRWEDIKMVLQEVGWESKDWIDVGQDGDRW